MAARMPVRLPTTSSGVLRARGLGSQLRGSGGLSAAAPVSLPQLRVRTRVVAAISSGGAETGEWGSSQTTSSDAQSPVQSRNGLLTSRFFSELVNIDRQIELKGEELLQKVYGPEEWSRHRLPGRHIKYLLSLSRCKYTFNVMAPMIASFFLTLLVGTYATILVPSFGLPALCKISVGAIGIFTSCLSLLLVFRTNNSYGRFDEARKLWGSFINRTRDIVRQCAIYFPSTTAGAESLRAVARWTAALAFCMRCHLRLPANEPIENLRGWLDDEELAVLAEHEHRPNCCMQVLGELIHMNVPNRLEALKVDENIKVFEDFVGACERIYRTPIPNSYTRHTSRFLSIWALLLPLAMWAEFSWTALFFAPLLTFLLFAIDEIGVQLEEPFGVLPLAQMCEKIRANTQEIVERSGSIRVTLYRRVGLVPHAAAAGVNGVEPVGVLSVNGHGSGVGHLNSTLLNSTLAS